MADQAVTVLSLAFLNGIIGTTVKPVPATALKAKTECSYNNYSKTHNFLSPDISIGHYYIVIYMYGRLMTFKGACGQYIVKQNLSRYDAPLPEYSGQYPEPELFQSH